jgi:hypothetical protein
MGPEPSFPTHQGNNAPETGEYAKKPYRDWHDKWVLTLLIAGFLAAGAAAIFTYWQADIAQETLKETREINRKQLRAYLFVRPYDWVNSVDAGKIPNTTVGVRNGGQTPASDVVVRLNIEQRQSPPENTQSSYLGTVQRAKIDVLEPAGAFSGIGQINMTEPIGVEHAKEIADGKAIRFYVWGALTYLDVFEDFHSAFFCYIYYGNDINTRDGSSISSRIRSTCPHPESK